MVKIIVELLSAVALRPKSLLSGEDQVSLFSLTSYLRLNATQKFVKKYSEEKHAELIL